MTHDTVFPKSGTACALDSYTSVCHNTLLLDLETIIMYRKAASRGHGQPIQHQLLRNQASARSPFRDVLENPKSSGRGGVVAPVPHLAQADVMPPNPQVQQSTQSYTADSPPTAANAPEKKPAAMAEKVIVTPTDRDILIGRGTKANDHPGNVRYRILVDSKKGFHLTRETRAMKRKICSSIIAALQSTNPPSRFLQQDPVTKYWYESSEEASREKVSQKLRQGVAEKRRAYQAIVALTLLSGGHVETNSKSVTTPNAEYWDRKFFSEVSGINLEGTDTKDLADLNAAFYTHFTEDPKERALLLKSDPLTNFKVPEEKEPEKRTQDMPRNDVLTKNNSKRVTRKLPVKRTSTPSKHALTPVKPSNRLTPSMALLLKSDPRMKSKVPKEKECANMISQDMSRNDILTKNRRVAPVPVSPPSKPAATCIKPSVRLSFSTGSMALLPKSDPLTNFKMPEEKEPEKITPDMKLPRNDVITKNYSKRVTRNLPVKRASPPSKHALTPVERSARLCPPMKSTESTELPTIIGYQKNCSVKRPKKTDVICGEGHEPKGHPGNARFREFVNSKTDLYIRSSPAERILILRSLVVALRSSYPPTRFLRRKPGTKMWQDIGNEKAEAQIHQQLRDCIRAKIVQETTSEARATEVNPKATGDTDSHTNAADSTRKENSYSSFELVFEACLAKEHLKEQMRKEIERKKKYFSSGKKSLKKSSPFSKHATPTIKMIPLLQRVSLSRFQAVGASRQCQARAQDATASREQDSCGKISLKESSATSKPAIPKSETSPCLQSVPSPRFQVGGISGAGAQNAAATSRRQDGSMSRQFNRPLPSVAAALQSINQREALIRREMDLMALDGNRLVAQRALSQLPRSGHLPPFLRNIDQVSALLARQIVGSGQPALSTKVRPQAQLNEDWLKVVAMNLRAQAANQPDSDSYARLLRRHLTPLDCSTLPVQSARSPTRDTHENVLANPSLRRREATSLSVQYASTTSTPFPCLSRDHLVRRRRILDG